MIRLQALVRKHQAVKAVTEMVKDHKARTSIVAEILTTERTYVDILRQIVEVRASAWWAIASAYAIAMVFRCHLLCVSAACVSFGNIICLQVVVSNDLPSTQCLAVVHYATSGSAHATHQLEGHPCYLPHEWSVCLRMRSSHVHCAENLYACHSTLLVQLESRWALWSPSQAVGDVFLQLVRHFISSFLC